MPHKFIHIGVFEMSSLADHNGASSSLFDLQYYRRMRSRNADFARALARTNLAIRCWLGRIGEMPADVEKLRGEHRRVMAWLLANHLVQAYYRRCGIDARPFAIGGMYGYGFAVGPQSPVCQRRDFWETAWVACSSVRVDPLDYDGQPGDAARSYEVAEAIAGEKTPCGLSTGHLLWPWGGGGHLHARKPNASTGGTPRFILPSIRLSPCCWRWVTWQMPSWVLFWIIIMALIMVQHLAIPCG